MFNSSLSEKQDPQLTPKARHTRQKILAAAYELFTRQGYDKATMREIAKEAGVVAGAIYHYFPNKEYMVQAFYEQLHLEHDEFCEDFLATELDLIKRLHFVLRKKIEMAAPYQKLSRVLFRVASDPENPLSPFSEQSLPTRRQSIAQFEKIVLESRDKLPKRLRDVLPHYLWLTQMGIILHWIHDTSPKCKSTFQLIDKSVVAIQSLLDMIHNPLLRPFRKKVIQMMTDFYPNLGVKHGKK